MRISNDAANIDLNTATLRQQTQETAATASKQTLTTASASPEPTPTPSTKVTLSAQALSLLNADASSLQDPLEHPAPGPYPGA